MVSIKKGLPFILMLVSCGCGLSETVDNMQRDMDELKNRMVKMEKDIGGMRSETKEGIEKSIRDFQKEMETTRKGNADFQASLESAKVDMQVLNGKVDDVRLLAQKPADDLALLKEDTDRRLAAMEERLAKLDRAFDELQKKLTETKAKEEQSPETLYQQGLAAIKGGDPQKAREYLNRFIELYPKNELLANVHYWIGESFYNEKKYDQAILEFQDVIKNFPGKEKIPAAMLKQGMAFKELGDTKSAKYVYKKLAEDFPSTDEAKTAKEKLRELK